MNRITLNRLVIYQARDNSFEIMDGGQRKPVYDRNFDFDRFKDERQYDDEMGILVYLVSSVVGSTSPYVGEYITPDYARDLCDQSGTWTVTFK